MSKGIYGYYDSENDYILVYPGKDSNIHKNKRHKDHLSPSKYDKQVINRVLQNNPDRYEYRVICEYPDLTDDELNWLECMEIMKHKFLYGEKPKFSFTVGGDGISGYRKPYEDFKYTVVKMGFNRGKQNYTIKDRDCNSIKQSINKEALDEIAVALNNGEITEEQAKIIELNPFKYTVSKSGFSNGKRMYTIYDKNYNSIKTSINKEFLDEIADSLNNGSLTEEEAKIIKLNPFKYTVSKSGFSNGKQVYAIRDRDNNLIKRSISKEVLDEIADSLNNGSLTEEEAKIINLNPFKYTVAKGGFQNGKQRYLIYGKNNKPIKHSINKEGLDKLAEELNNGLLTEEEAKKIRINRRWLK